MKGLGPPSLAGKFSSTVITSLATGVPVIVTKRFLLSYTFLSEAHVWLQGDAEETMDASLRLLQLPIGKVAALRSGISQLREKLNERAAAQIQAVIDGAEGWKGSGPLPRLEAIAHPNQEA